MRPLQALAYDSDPLMCAALEQHCSDEIAAGQVTLYQGPYPRFLKEQIPTIRREHSVGLITASFAPLTLVDDLPALFAALHAPPRRAMLLASVLNPDFPDDWRHRWWWANRFTYWRQGQLCIHGEHSHIHRRSRRTLAALAAPWFRLESVHGCRCLDGEMASPA